MFKTQVFFTVSRSFCDRNGQT